MHKATNLSRFRWLLCSKHLHQEQKSLCDRLDALFIIYKCEFVAVLQSHAVATMVIMYCRSVLVREEDEKSSISFIFITEIGICFLYVPCPKITITVVDFPIACLISCLIILLNFNALEIELHFSVLQGFHWIFSRIAFKLLKSYHFSHPLNRCC